MLAIYKKELRSYVTSMTGYVFVAFFLVIIGLYFTVYNLMKQYANFEYVLSSVSFIFVLLIPILTMRLMAEDKRQKTDQLLYTAPIKISDIVIGKYFAVFTVFLSVIVIISFYPLILTLFGNVSLPMAYSSIFGFALLGGAYLALGLFISSLTESQVVAAVISFVVMLLTALMDGIISMFPTDNKSAFYILWAMLLVFCFVVYLMIKNIIVTLSVAVVGGLILSLSYMLNPVIFDGILLKIFGWFSMVDRYQSFVEGLFQVSSVVYYISLIGVFLFLTTQSIKKQRFS